MVHGKWEIKYFSYDMANGEMLAGINAAFTPEAIACPEQSGRRTLFQAKIVLAALLITGPAAFGADNQSREVQQSAAPERISFLVTFGEEKCPEAAGDEIVVCAVQPESDRYRIPKNLREKEDAAVAGGSWTSAVESLDGYARATLPNSCSVNGSNGFTGCTQQLLQQWHAERRGKINAN